MATRCLLGRIIRFVQGRDVAGQVLKRVRLIAMLCLRSRRRQIITLLQVRYSTEDRTPRNLTCARRTRSSTEYLLYAASVKNTPGGAGSSTGLQCQPKLVC
jgi:hypothetical protein